VQSKEKHFGNLSFRNAFLSGISRSEMTKKRWWLDSPIAFVHLCPFYLMQPTTHKVVLPLGYNGLILAEFSEVI
jgi:hypothetical protein